MDILTVSHVSKAFKNQQIIKDLSFSIPEHTVFGFIGQNGAGKTTTMKMILGLLKTDAGEIYVHGEKVNFGQNKTNRYIGYLPDVPEFYDYMTPREYLSLCGEITGMEQKEKKERIEDLLAMVGLSEANKRIKGFSRGMKQRLGIAQALLNRPKLLICDEPTSALDPLGRKEILDILVKAKKETTILFSTHILSDVERICDEIAFLHQGKIVMEGNLEQIKAEHIRNGLEIEFLRPEDMAVIIKSCPGGKQTGMQRLVYDGQSGQDMLHMMEMLVKNGIEVQKIEMAEPNLEDLFMEVAVQ